MARPRKVVIQTHKNSVNNDTSSNSGSENGRSEKRPKILSFWKTIVGCICLSIAVYIGILGYLETRVNTPFDDQKIVQLSGVDVPERYWGTYRPGHYMGIKSRDPKSPVFGLMWYQVASKIRHWCDQNDDLKSYTWTRHDGVSFGEQQIDDPPFKIVTSFIKTPGGQHGGHWTARVNVSTVDNTPKTLMLAWYVALDESFGPEPESRLWVESGSILGYTPQLNNFRVSFSFTGTVAHKSFSEANAPGLHLLKEKYYSLLRMETKEGVGRFPSLIPDEELGEGNQVNFVPIQILVETPFALDVLYTTEDLPVPPLKGEEYSAELERRKAGFDEECERKFHLAEKGYSETEISIARSALSNMLGGIGYFYGTSRVRSAYTKEPVPYWRAPLYTAVPSRSFFPRGFLWDEGFHGLLIGRWSPDIQMDIASHWLDLINVEGWIPREQILGVEALARVPKEFVVQSNAAANPPMLMIQIAHFVKTKPQLFEPGSKHRSTLDRMFSRLQAWYQWFHTSQKGSVPTSYRWRGRVDDGLELNPKTLTSGLDDYPRASHPSDIERHVDLRCWMFAAADAMATIANVLQRDTTKFEATRDQLADEDLLNELHWSAHTETYADYGLHTDGVALVRRKPRKPHEQAIVVRSVTTPPQPRLVTSAFGYVSLFPMLLKVLKPDSEKLGKILEKLDNPDLLWSPFGLRSLSKSSPLYMKRNTEHDPPYWRGQIWLNINYLALAALKHYSLEPGPHRDRAGKLHARLKQNVIGNVLSQYTATGYLWEQYSDGHGRGAGCRPFTGWTALATLAMADEY